jgi:hypothetical protein
MGTVILKVKPSTEPDLSYELRHAGVKGMKWGVRRFRNEDGTLTEAGKKRYGSGGKTKTKKEPHPDYAEVHPRKKVKYMSNEELKRANNRLNAEKQYKDLTKRKNYGKSAVKAFIAGAGTITGVVAAAKVYQKYGSIILDKIGDWIIPEEIRL